MKVCMIWLGGVCKSLPVDLRSATALAAARAEAEAHYADLTDLVSRLAMMDDDAQRTELYEDNLVYRSKNSADATEAEAALKRISAAKQELARRTNAQNELNRRMGGTSAMDMLHEALDAALQESDELHARHEEAVRRIDHAESIAVEADQYRITDARTKLRRMERHQVMVDSKLHRIEEDLAQANAVGLRFEKPSVAGGVTENEMILQSAADMLLRGGADRKTLEVLWPCMIRPVDTLTIKQTMKAIRRAPVDREIPLMSLLQAMMENAMKEV
jgi:hypothetical protein